MKRFKAAAQRATAFVLAASMMSSAVLPTVFAAQPLNAENSVDELGNEDLSDETDTALDETADAADHTWGEWYDGTYQEGEDGKIQNVKIRICSDCGVLQLEDGTVLTPSTDEKLEIDDPDEPEWLMPGVNLDGNYDDQIAPCDSVGIHDGKHEFDYTGATNVKVWYSRPTCTQTGSALVRCIKWWHVKVFNPLKWEWQESSGQCDYSETHTIWAYGHAWGAWTTVTEATCGADGLKKRVCGRDGSHVETEPIPATGNHDWGEWTTAEATCTAPGKKYRTCKICQKEEVDDTYAANHPATGHQTGGVKWTEGDNSEVGWVVDQPHKCVDGTKTRSCDDCDVTETVTVPASEEHQPSDWIVTLEPTCTTTGTHIKKCLECGAELESETMDALGHAWDEGTIDQKFPCVDGTITYKCTRDGCDATKTETYKAVADHSYGAWYDDYEYGCKTQNKSHDCLLCGHKETVDSGNPVRKHKYTNYVMSTPNRWTTVKVAVNLPNWAVTALKALGVKFDNENKHILISDSLPTPIVRADCEYGCGEYDELNAVEYPEFAAQAWAATEASKSVADTATPLIQEALGETKNAVNNAQNREEAIAALDQIYLVAKQKIMDQGSVNVKVDLRITGTWPSNYPLIGGQQWTVKLYEGNINVPITEDIADGALAQLKAVIEDAKNMLSNSFLSEDAIKVALNKVVDTVAGDSGLHESVRQLSFYPIYNSINKRNNDTWPNQATDSTQTETAQLILRLANELVEKKDDPNADAWQQFLSAIYDNLIDMLIEELKKDPDYGKYLNNALGDELLAELRVKLREELVNDSTFVDTIRGVVGDAVSNAANGVNHGWSDQRVLTQLREDLLKVQEPVEQEMIKLSGTIGDLVEDSLKEKINKLLPFGSLTSWIGDKVGAYAKDIVADEVLGETGTVRNTIEMYIKYITCGEHHHATRIAQEANCTNDEITEDYCTKCDWVFGKEKTKEAWGHTPELVPGTDPTETEEGLTDGTKCAVCGRWIEPQQVVPALQPRTDKWLVTSAVTTENIRAAGYENQQKLDAAINAVLTKAGFDAASSTRFFAQVNSTIGILPNDRYPEEGVAGMVKQPEATRNKNCTFYAVQVLTADSHGHNAGDVVVTPLTVTKEGISLTLCTEAVVAIAWKVNE